MSAPVRIRWTRLARLARDRLAVEGITPKTLCGRAGLSRRSWSEIAAGRKAPADPYLALCAFLGVDPVTQQPAAAAMPAFMGRIAWPFLAAALVARTGAAGLGLRDAAAAIGVSAATLSRVGRGGKVSAHSYLKVCAFIGRHPNEMTVPVKAMEAAADPGFGRADALAEMERARPVADRIGRVDADKQNVSVGCFSGGFT